MNNKRIMTNLKNETSISTNIKNVIEKYFMGQNLSKLSSLYIGTY